jgi:hypothetical protein
MAKLTKVQTLVEARAVITLEESEILALDALAWYGVDAFLRVFYKELGKAYMGPHENGLRTLFEAVSGCSSLVYEAAECREFLEKANKHRAGVGKR